MSKEELQKEENILFKEIQKEFPEFKKSAKNNFLNLLVKGIATRGYSLKRLADSFIAKTTSIDGGDLDYRASFYGITRKQPSKSSGVIVLTGLIDAEIPQNTYFIDGNYINNQIAKISNYTGNGIANINGNVVVVSTNTINELPSGIKINVNIDGLILNDVIILESTESTFKFEFDNTEGLSGNKGVSYNLNCVFLKIESINTGREYNLGGNIEFNINQVITNIDEIAFTTPQGLNGGEDLESNDRLKLRWDLARTGYIANFSPDYIRNFLLENFSQITRIFIQRATPSAGYVSIYPLLENRDNGNNILPSAPETTQIRDLLLTIAPASIDSNNILILSANKIPINISYTSFLPSTISMNKAIRDTISLFFKSQNEVGKDFAKDDLLIYLLANCIDSNNDKLLSINLNATDTSIANNEIAVLGGLNA